VGNRQDGREVSDNVLFAPPVTGEIVSSVQAQLAHGRYTPSSLYGDGYVSERIANALSQAELYVQKRLHYTRRDAAFPAGDEFQRIRPGDAVNGGSGAVVSISKSEVTR
jgi:hypothetical protein